MQISKVWLDFVAKRPLSDETNTICIPPNKRARLQDRLSASLVPLSPVPRGAGHAAALRNHCGALLRGRLAVVRGTGPCRWRSLLGPRAALAPILGPSAALAQCSRWVLR